MAYGFLVFIFPIHQPGTLVQLSALLHLLHSSKSSMNEHLVKETQHLKGVKLGLIKKDICQLAQSEEAKYNMKTPVSCGPRPTGPSNTTLELLGPRLDFSHVLLNQRNLKSELVICATC